RWAPVPPTPRSSVVHASSSALAAVHSPTPARILRKHTNHNYSTSIALVRALIPELPDSDKYTSTSQLPSPRFLPQNHRSVSARYARLRMLFYTVCFVPVFSFDATLPAPAVRSVASLLA